MSDALYPALLVVLGIAVGYALRPIVARFDAAVPARLPLPEIACGVLFGVAAARYEDTWRLVPVLVLLATCMALAIVDFVQYRLPNDLLFPGLLGSVALMTAGQLIDGDPGRIVHIGIGALLYCAVLLVMHLLNPAGLGFGDVKLAILLGSFLGWVSASRLESVRAVMLALLIGSALGVVLGVGRMLALRLGGDFMPDPVESEESGWHKTTFPFGPPLMAGTIAVVLWPATFLG